MRGETFGALVIGGGINGFSALYHLQRLGAERLGLIEQFSIGHDRGSSHGAARITRSAYGEPEYVRLMQWVHAEEWPRLEKDAGRQLRYPNPGLFIGPPCEYFNKYIQAVQQEGVDVEAVTPAEARSLYPQFTFENVETALLDRTAAIVSAQETMESLASLARRNTNPKKIYCIDHALVASVSAQILINSGHLLENLVFVTLRRNHQEIYYYKTRGGREVDFIVPRRRARLLLVQVCESLVDPATRRRETAALSDAMGELDVTRGTIVTRDEQERIECPGGTVEVVPIWRFLLDS